MLKCITLEIIGERKLVCGGCEERIEGLLKKLEGVNKVRAKAHNQHVEILFNAARLDANAIAEYLLTAGYRTRVAN